MEHVWGLFKKRQKLMFRSGDWTSAIHIKTIKYEKIIPGWWSAIKNRHMQKISWKLEKNFIFGPGFEPATLKWSFWSPNHLAMTFCSCVTFLSFWAAVGWAYFGDWASFRDWAYFRIFTVDHIRQRRTAWSEIYEYDKSLCSLFSEIWYEDMSV